MNKYFLKIDSTKDDAKYFVVDLVYSKLNAGILVKAFDSSNDARLFWNNQHTKFVALHVVHDASLFI